MKSGDSRLLGPIIRTFSLLYDLCYLAHLCSLAGYLALAPGPAPAGVLLALQHHRIFSTIISLLNRQFLVVCAAIALVLLCFLVIPLLPQLCLFRNDLPRYILHRLLPSRNITDVLVYGQPVSNVWMFSV